MLNSDPTTSLVSPFQYLTKKIWTTSKGSPLLHTKPHQNIFSLKELKNCSTSEKNTEKKGISIASNRQFSNKIHRLKFNVLTSVSESRCCTCFVLLISCSSISISLPPLWWVSLLSLLWGLAAGDPSSKSRFLVNLHYVLIGIQIFIHLLHMLKWKTF